VGNTPDVVFEEQPDSCTTTVANVPRPSNGNAGNENENAAISNVLPQLALFQQQQKDQMEKFKQEQQLQEMKQKNDLEEFKQEQQLKEETHAATMQKLRRQLQTQSANTKSIVQQIQTDKDLSDKVSSEEVNYDVRQVAMQAKKDEPKAAAVAPKKKKVRFEMQIDICSCYFYAHLICCGVYDTRDLIRAKVNRKRVNTIRR
jgi:hypothetical protein